MQSSGGRPAPEIERQERMINATEALVNELRVTNDRLTDLDVNVTTVLGRLIDAINALGGTIMRS